MASNVNLHMEKMNQYLDNAMIDSNQNHANLSLINQLAVMDQGASFNMNKDSFLTYNRTLTTKKSLSLMMKNTYLTHFLKLDYLFLMNSINLIKIKKQRILSNDIFIKLTVVPTGIITLVSA